MSLVERPIVLSVSCHLVHQIPALLWIPKLRTKFFQIINWPLWTPQTTCCLQHNKCSIAVTSVTAACFVARYCLKNTFPHFLRPKMPNVWVYSSSLPRGCRRWFSRQSSGHRWGAVPRGRWAASTPSILHQNAQPGNSGCCLHVHTTYVPANCSGGAILSILGGGQLGVKVKLVGDGPQKVGLES